MNMCHFIWLVIVWMWTILTTSAQPVDSKESLFTLGEIASVDIMMPGLR
jgi:hypothetical protein